MKAERIEPFGLNLAPRDGDFFFRYESLGEFMNTAEKCSSGRLATDNEFGGMEWYGGRTFQEACAMARYGDPALVPEAEKLLESISAGTNETPRGVWEPSPTGAYPIVPEYLAGHPTSMREFRRVQSEYGPVSLYVHIGASQGFSAEDIRARGITILAFLAKLQIIRPVELYLVSTTGCKASYSADPGNNVLVIKLETRPIDLSVAGFVMADASFLRRVILNSHCAPVGRAMDSRIPWATCYNSGTVEKYIGVGPDDIYIGPAHLSHKDLIRQPVKWINEQLARYGAGVKE